MAARRSIVLAPVMVLAAARCSLLTPLDDLRPARDASPAVDASESCADAWFCEKFDDGPLYPLWSVSGLSDASVIGFDDASFTSPPNSLRARTTNGSKPCARHDLVALAPGVRWSLSFQLKIDQRPNYEHEIEIASVVLNDPPNVRVDMTPTNLKVFSEDVDGGPQQVIAAAAPPLGTWVTIKLDLDFTTTPATGTLALAGVTIGTFSYDRSLKRARPAVLLGVCRTNGADPWDVQFDDVVLRATP